MNARQINALAGLVATLAVSSEPARAANPANTWRDCVTVNGAGTYNITPGNWTRNGVVIGQTWIGGGSVTGPAATACSNIRFPPGVVPNDFHYSGDTFVDGNGNVTIISAYWIWGDFVPPPPPIIVSSSGNAQLYMQIDWNGSPADPYLYVTDGVQAYSGVLSGFVPSAYNMAIVGERPLALEGSAFTPFCFGDGTGASCPCGNNGAAGNGCANSVDPAGAHLVGSGSASLSSDTVSLSASGMPFTASAILFQGTSAINGGSGAPFGDGLRCAGGAVIRFDTGTSSGGAVSYPLPGGPSISVDGEVTSPGTRMYQVWYRNAGAFCTASTFNLTNAVEITWSP